MKPDEIRKLLGGYATGTLTERERELLFSAALEDQALFDALANEEALREFLAVPGMREELLEELQTSQQGGAQETNHVAAHHAAMPAAPQAAVRYRSTRSGVYEWFSTRRLAWAGGVAVVLLAVGIQYSLLAPKKQPVDLAMTKNPVEREGSPQVAQNEPPSAPAIPRQATSPKANGIAQVGQLADQSPAAPALEKRAAALERRQDERAAEGKASDGKKEADQLARNEFAAGAPAERQAAPPPPAAVPLPAGEPLSGRVMPPPAPKSAPAQDAGQVKAREGVADTATAAVGGQAGAALSLTSPLNARITDVNGTIVTVNAGSNAGLKAGDMLEIVRDGAVLGTIRVTEAAPGFSVGPYQPASARPRVGDAVRRPANPAPVR